MNKKQKAVLIAGIALVLMSGLFPPYELVVSRDDAGLYGEGAPIHMSKGFHCIFAPPKLAQVTVTQFLVQIGTIVLVTGGLMALLSIQGAGVVPKAVRANAFILVDKNGKERAKLQMDKDGGPSLTLWDEKGKLRALLSVFKGAVLNLCDEKGRPRAGLGVTEVGVALSLTGENLMPHAMLSVLKDGTKLKTKLSLSDENGKFIWSAP